MAEEKREELSASEGDNEQLSDEGSQSSEGKSEQSSAEESHASKGDTEHPPHKESQTSGGDTEQYLHLKASEVEVKFKHGRPKRAFKIVLGVEGERTYKSHVFPKTGVIKWEQGIYLKPTAIVTIKLKAVYGTRFKMNITNRKSYARAILDHAKVRPSDDPRTDIEVAFGDPLPLGTVVRLLGDETMSALESKVKLLEKAETALSVSEAVVKLAGAAGQVVPGANTIVPIAQIVFDRCKEINEAHQTAVAMMDNINAFLPLINQLEASMEKKDAKDYLNTLHVLIKDILDVLLEYSKHSNISFYMRRWIISKKTTFDGLQKRVDAMRDNINTYFQAQMERNVAIINGNTAKTERTTAKILDNQLLQVLDRLKPISEALKYDAQRGCLAGTREKLIKDVLRKLKSKGNNPVACWVRGPAGIGKTTISISLAEKLKESGRFGGCFIFDRKIPKQREPRNVLPTLAYSLALVYPPYRDHVMSTLESNPTVAGEWPKDQLKTLFPSDIKVETPRISFVFVVDALDECAMDDKSDSNSASDRKNMASRLMEITKNIPWLRVVITSRPNEEILEVFGEGGSESRSVTSFDLNRVGDATNDIYKFNEAWVKSDGKLHKIWTEPWHLQKLTDRANGLFIWSSTVRDYVQKALDRNFALEKIMEKTETDRDLSVNTLDKLYRFVLEQVDGDAKVIRTALGVLVATARNKPLSQTALFELIPSKFEKQGLTNDALKSIFGRLQSVLYIDEDGIVRICHPSFLDFLNSKDRAGDFWTDPAEINAELFQQCIYLMKCNLKFNICKLDSAYVFNSEVPDLKARIKKEIPEYLRYSCVHWMDHLLLAKERGFMLDSVRETIRDFLYSVKSLFWLEAMSLMEEVESGINALGHCYHSFDVHDKKVSDASRELYRFATTYRSVMTSSTPHIYISALSWAPVNLPRAIFTEFLHQPATIISGKARCWEPVTWQVYPDRYTEFKYVQLSPDGNYLACSSRWELTVCSTLTGKAVSSFYGPKGHFQFSYDAKSIFACEDGKLFSWNIATRTSQAIPLDGVDDVEKFRLSPVKNEIVILTREKALCIWNLTASERKFGPIDLHDSVSCIRYSTDGEFVAVGFNDGSIRVMGSSDGVLKEYTLSKEKSRCIKDLVFSPSGGRAGRNSGFICSIYSDHAPNLRNLSVWNVHTGELISELTPTEDIGSVAFTSDDCCILTARWKGRAYSWRFIEKTDWASLRRCQLRGSYEEYETLDVSDGRYIVFGDKQRIRLRSLLDVKQEMTQRHADHIMSIDCSPDGIILSASLDGSICTWDIETGKKSGESILQIHTFAQFSPSGEHIVSCNGAESVIVWDAKRKEKRMTLEFTQGTVYTRCFYSFDGCYIIALSDRTRRIHVWYSSTGKLRPGSGKNLSQILGDPTRNSGLPDLKDHKKEWHWLYPRFDITISPSSNHVILMHTYGPVVHYVYDFLSDTMISTLRTGGRPSSSVYSPDGSEILRVEGGSLFFYEASTGAALSERINTINGTIREAIYSPDGKHLILADDGWKIWIVDRESWKIVKGPIQGHTGTISRMKFSRPDGRYLVTGSHDTSVRTWDVDFIMQLSEQDLNSVINVYEDGTRNISVGPATAVDKDKTLARTILPQSLLKDGWYRNAEGRPLLWIPEEYRTDAFDMSKSCTARHELSFDLERLSQYEGPKWVDIYKKKYACISLRYGSGINQKARSNLR